MKTMLAGAAVVAAGFATQAHALVHLGKLTGPWAPYSAFGYTMAVSDGRLLVGAPRRPDAWLFDVETGEELRKIRYTGDETVQFGVSLDMTATHMIVGAPRQTNYGGGSNQPDGVAAIFDGSGDLLRMIRAPDEGEPGYTGERYGFGDDVALYEDRAYVSGRVYDLETGEFAGMAEAPEDAYRNVGPVVESAGYRFVGDPDWGYTLSSGGRFESVGAVRVFGDLRYVPAPAALPLALSGLLGIAWVGRRRKAPAGAA